MGRTRRQTNVVFTGEDADYRDGDGSVLPSPELMEVVRARHGNKLLLSFSRGKDSLALWLHLRDHGFELYPFYLYMAPNIPHHDAEIAYYEDWFGQHIVQLPHPLFVQYLNWYNYQPPENIAVIIRFNMANYDLAMVDEFVREHYGLPEDTLCAVGFRGKDNLMRRNLIHQQGAVGLKHRKYYYGIWDWDINQTCQRVIDAGMAISQEYAIWGRTITAYDYQYLKPLKEYLPDSYAALQRWFPHIDMEIYRHEVVCEYARSKEAQQN